MERVYENRSSEIFPGFYNSILNPFEYENSLCGTHAPDGYYFDYIDFKVYTKEIAEAWWDFVDSLCNNKDTINFKILGVKNIRSPREYNFTTDKTNVNISFDDSKLKQYCFNDEITEFASYLKDNWSGYDGFISFVPNTVEGFKNELEFNEDLYDVLVEFFLLQNCNFESVESWMVERIDNITGWDACLVDDKGNKWDYVYDDFNDRYVPTTIIKEE